MQFIRFLFAKIMIPCKMRARRARRAVYLRQKFFYPLKFRKFACKRYIKVLYYLH